MSSPTVSGHTNVIRTQLTRPAEVPKAPSAAKLGRDIRSLRPLHSARKRVFAQREFYTWPDGSNLIVERRDDGKTGWSVFRERNRFGSFNHFIARDGHTITTTNLATERGVLRFVSDSTGLLVEAGGPGSYFGVTSQADVDRIGREVNHYLVTGAEITSARFVDTDRDGRFDHVRLGATVRRPLTLGWRLRGH